eukprot:snap_masked-scaffold_1-processed-gene-31.22-mRNA-1 protein AED:0.08 eAED:0.08 QI:0/-1/0/1/-1/1/1/0/167
MFTRYLSSAVKGPSTFKVLGVQQIAIGAEKKSDLAHLWIDLFGVKKQLTFKSEKENVNEDVLLLGKDDLDPHAVEIDLMEPLDSGKSPKVHIPPLNHIGLWVDNITGAYSELEEKGVRFTPGGIRKGASGHDVCFIHPKGNDTFPLSGAGVLIELVQAPDYVIAAKK